MDGNLIASLYFPSPTCEASLEDEAAIKDSCPREGKPEWKGQEEHSVGSGGQLGSLKEGSSAKDETCSLTPCPRPPSATNDQNTIYPFRWNHPDAKGGGYVFCA